MGTGSELVQNYICDPDAGLAVLGMHLGNV